MPDFSSGVATPGGASYMAPLLNFQQFGNWAQDFQQGGLNSQQQRSNDQKFSQSEQQFPYQLTFDQQQQKMNEQRIAEAKRQADLAKAFPNGLPTDPNTGQIDYAKTAQVMAKFGDVGDAVTLLGQQPAPQSHMFDGVGQPGQPQGQPQSVPAKPLPAPTGPQGDSGSGTITSMVTDKLPSQNQTTGQTIMKIAEVMGVDANATLTPGQIRRAQGLLKNYAPEIAGVSGGGGSLPPSANAGTPAPQITKQPAPGQGAPNGAASPQPAQPAQQPGQLVSSLPAADAALNLNAQEKALYRRHLANLTGSGGVDNDGSDPKAPAGSRSTLFVNTFGIGGKTYVIPSVWNGKVLSPDESLARAKKEGLDKFPSYASEQEASARYSAMHQFMEKDTAQVLGARGPGAGQPGQPQVPQQPPPQQQSQAQPPQPQPAQPPQGGPIVPQVPLPKGFNDPQQAILALKQEAARLSANPRAKGQVDALNDWANRIEESIKPLSVNSMTTMVDPRTGRPVFQGPGAAAMGSSRETGATLDADAENYRQTGKLPPNMGRGIQGQQESNAIRTRAAEMEIGEGGNPADWSSRWQSFATQAAGKRALETRAAGLSLAENEASSLIPRVREISSKIKRTDYPTLNSLILASQKGSGGQDVIKLGIAVESLVPVYARVLKPVGQVGQGDMARAHDILDKAWSDGQINAALDQMQVELKSARTALDKTMSESANRGRDKKEDPSKTPDQPGGTTPSGLKWSVE